MTNTSPGQDLDLSFLEEIADGSVEFMVESIDMFLVHTPEALQAINAAIKNQEWPLAATAAHKLKPNLGFFGMEVSAIINENISSLIEIKAEEEAKL